MLRISTRLFTGAAASLMLVASISAAHAADPGKPQTPQQQRMTECAHANKGKKGDDYKSSMSSCLKGGKPAPVHRPTQQEKMKTCNNDASGKKLMGDDRRKFMSACLKN